jgi:hypothetical protein
MLRMPRSQRKQELPRPQASPVLPMSPNCPPQLHSASQRTTLPLQPVRPIRALAFIGLFLASAAACFAQAALRPASLVSSSVSGPSRTSLAGLGPIRSDIFDPCLGKRWELAVDPLHPAGPWRMVLVDSGPEPSVPANVVRAASSALPDPSSPGFPAPAIRAGDRVTVEQRTAWLQARFTAVALESAGVGASFRVRLTSARNAPGPNSGPVLKVRATASGRALWDSTGSPVSPATEGARP